MSRVDMGKRRLILKRKGYRLLALSIVLMGVVATRYRIGHPDSHHVFYVDIPPPLESEAGDRDLSQYDFGGRVANCEQQEDDGKCYEERETARKFIEDHFNHRRRGYVIIDGASFDIIQTAHFFIEPDEAGNWEVRVRKHVPGPYTRFHRNIETSYYTEVFRRRAPIGELNIKPGFPALVLRSRGVYELLL